VLFFVVFSDSLSHDCHDKSFPYFFIFGAYKMKCYFIFAIFNIIEFGYNKISLIVILLFLEFNYVNSYKRRNLNGFDTYIQSDQSNIY
jgi:cellulose synthase/poly-beta-1,6-N-acetylglucosamine synthase-like glycosyltransferase